jgi:sugar/nucleoside kinase (ribokinase family)
LNPRYQVIHYGVYFCDLIFTGLPKMPALGQEAYGNGFEIRAGASFNPALAFHRLGVRSGWVCDFGDDLFSRYVLERCQEEGIDPGLFEILPIPLQRVSVAVSFPQDRAFISYMDPMRLPPLPPILLKERPEWLYLPNLYLGEKYEDIFSTAREAGIKVYMDCQFTEETVENPEVRAAIGAVDIFAPNQLEALQLTGAASLDEAMAILSRLAPLVIIKCGAQGAYACQDSRVIHSPGLNVEQVVDTTGAGDCFNAGFLYGLLRGEPLERCLRLGNICGGLSVTATGGSAVPTADEVEKYLQTRPQEDGSSNLSWAVI